GTSFRAAGGFGGVIGGRHVVAVERAADRRSASGLSPADAEPPREAQCAQQRAARRDSRRGAEGRRRTVGEGLGAPRGRLVFFVRIRPLCEQRRGPAILFTGWSQPVG